jgi:hypothetical protein
LLKMAESMNYEVYKEYEAVLLKIKALKKIVRIGDFYGDVEKVIISPEERCCVMAGCGIIIYFLHEPFIPYEYGKVCEQWKEWYRSENIWIRNVVMEKESVIEIEMENGEKTKIQIGLDLKRN